MNFLIACWTEGSNGESRDDGVWCTLRVLVVS